MNLPRKELLYCWFMGCLIALLGIAPSLSPSIALANTGINVPSVDDKFYKPKEGPKAEKQKEVNNEHSKVDAKKKDDGPDLWAVSKFVLNDFIKEIAGGVEPYISNPPYFDKESRQWIDPNSPKNFFYSTFVKMPRAMVGLAFEDGSYGKILIDLWDGGEKSRDAYKQVRTLQQINTLENLTLSSALTYTERLEQAKKLKTVSKFSKGVGIFGITISVVDFTVNVSNAINAFNKGNSKKVGIL